MFEEMVKKPASWLTGDGANAGIVISSRIRHARNISNFPFPPVADVTHKEKILSLFKAAVSKNPHFKKGNLLIAPEVTDLDRTFLVERHLISPEFLQGKSFQGVFINKDETLSVMINEEDHLRIQALQGGLKLDECYQLSSQAEEELGKILKFDYDSEFGFLTSCPTNVGTGMRASILIHLPGLVLTREIDGVISKMTKSSIAVRGFYGEGSDVLGNLFQISNQNTLGKSEVEILESISKVVAQVAEAEEKARETLFKDAKEQIEDKIWQAYGILKHARMLSSTEVMNLLSAVRLGVGCGTINQVSLNQINEILVLSQPAHLQKYFNRQMEANERDATRVELVRLKLNGKGKSNASH
ncbi:MAG TPA: protein arginine kinase [candidate division Zixibacteria bacterium]|nr:protein arginine kinase [candidate division Zixibacteria bacterium]